MIRRNKAAIIIAGMIFLTSAQGSFAINNDLQNNEIKINKSTLSDGRYTIENDALYADKDKESVARKYIDKISNIEIKDGNIYITFRFLEKDVIKNIKFKINNKELEVDKVG